MEFEINYEDSKIVSVDKIYPGFTENGQKFEIHANWNDWDDWSVDDVTFESDDFEESLKESIIDEFLEEMNS
jgi:hypothetical protein